MIVNNVSSVNFSKRIIKPSSQKVNPKPVISDNMAKITRYGKNIMVALCPGVK